MKMGFDISRPTVARGLPSYYIKIIQLILRQIFQRATREMWCCALTGRRALRLGRRPNLYRSTERCIATSFTGVCQTLWRFLLKVD